MARAQIDHHNRQRLKIPYYQQLIINFPKYYIINIFFLYTLYTQFTMQFFEEPYYYYYYYTYYYYFCKESIFKLYVTRLFNIVNNLPYRIYVFFIK